MVSTTTEILDKFDISKNGFLPEKCISKFPEKYKAYQSLLDNMHDVENYREYIYDIILRSPSFNLIDSLTESSFGCAFPAYII